MKKAQGATEYLLILGAILAIVVVIILILNYLLAAPEQSIPVNEDKYACAIFSGAELVDYLTLYNGSIETAPDAIVYKEERYGFARTKMECLEGDLVCSIGAKDGGGQFKIMYIDGIMQIEAEDGTCFVVTAGLYPPSFSPGYPKIDSADVGTDNVDISYQFDDPNDEEWNSTAILRINNIKVYEAADIPVNKGTLIANNVDVIPNLATGDTLNFTVKVDDNETMTTGWVSFITILTSSNQDPVAQIASIATIPEDATTTFVPFDGSTSYDPEAGPITYSWDIEPDTVEDSTDALFTESYPFELVSPTYTGPHTATLTVEDTEGATGTATEPWAINDLPRTSITSTHPDTEDDGTQNVTVPIAVDDDFFFSCPVTDDYGGIDQIQLLDEADALIYGPVTCSGAATCELGPIPVTVNNLDERTFKCKAVDTDTLWGITSTIHIVPYSEQPTAIIETIGTINEETTGTDVFFDGSNSFDPAGEDLTHSWDIEPDTVEDSIAESFTQSYPFVLDPLPTYIGPHTAELTVADPYGLDHTATEPWAINDLPRTSITSTHPDAVGSGTQDVTIPIAVDTGFSATCSASDSYNGIDYVYIYNASNPTEIFCTKASAPYDCPIGFTVSSLDTNEFVCKAIDTDPIDPLWGITSTLQTVPYIDWPIANAQPPTILTGLGTPITLDGTMSTDDIGVEVYVWSYFYYGEQTTCDDDITTDIENTHITSSAMCQCVGELIPATGDNKCDLVEYTIDSMQSTPEVPCAAGRKVWLGVYDADGNNVYVEDSETDSWDYVCVEESPPPTVSIECTDGCSPSPALGEQFTLTATAEDTDGTIERIDFFVDDPTHTTPTPFCEPGTTPATCPATYLLVTEGTHTIEARATDDLGGVGWATFAFDLNNLFPTASFTSDQDVVNITEAATFTSSSTDQSPGYIDVLSWDFGDGATCSNTTGTCVCTQGGDTFTAECKTVTHFYNTAPPITYTTTLDVTDDYGGTDSATGDIKVNDFPVASAADQPAGASTTVTLDAVGSSDDWGIFEYVWKDDTTGTILCGATNPPTTTCDYTAPSTSGNYIIRLEVTDIYNLTSTDTMALDVTNEVPTLSNYYVDPASGTWDDIYTYYVDYYDPEGVNPTYATISIDGAADYDLLYDGLYDGKRRYYNATTAGNPELDDTLTSHTYTLTFSDGENEVVETRSGPIVNDPPVAEANGPYTCVATLPCDSFDGIGSYDPEAGPITYSWDFGDSTAACTNGDTCCTGPSDSCITAEHTYTTDGSYTATLTVTDDQGAPDTDTASVTVDPLVDTDFDTVPDALDNCPLIANTLQEDGDFDTVGDVCDNCPLIANTLQEDADSDTYGDVCDCAPLDDVCGLDCFADITTTGEISSGFVSLFISGTVCAPKYNVYQGGTLIAVTTQKTYMDPFTKVPTDYNWTEMYDPADQIYDWNTQEFDTFEPGTGYWIVGLKPSTWTYAGSSGSATSSTHTLPTTFNTFSMPLVESTVDYRVGTPVDSFGQMLVTNCPTCTVIQIIKYNANTQSNEGWDAVAQSGDSFDMYADEGYRIIINEPTTFTLQGTEGGTRQVPVEPDWNLVGYTSMDAAPIPNTMSLLGPPLCCEGSYQVAALDSGGAEVLQGTPFFACAIQDSDSDGVCDDLDECPGTTGGSVGPNGCPNDQDGDGVSDGTDNCPSVSNNIQEDADTDGIGDVCEIETISAFNTPGVAYDVFVSGTTAYVADDSSLQIIDVADPYDPKFLGSHPATNAYSVFVSGTVAYVAAGNLLVIDVADPADPQLLVSVPMQDNVGTPGSAQDVFISGDIAYVAAWGGDFQIFDISSPADTYYIGTRVVSGAFVRTVHVSGNTAYAGVDLSTGLRTFDKIGLTPLGSATPSYYPFGIFASGTTAYVATGPGGLDVFDVATPASPTLVTTLSSSSASSNNAYVSGTTLYNADIDQGVLVYDASVPLSPVFFGKWLGNSKAVTVVENKVYSASGGSGLYIGQTTY